MRDWHLSHSKIWVKPPLGFCYGDSAVPSFGTSSPTSKYRVQTTLAAIFRCCARQRRNNNHR